MKKRVVLLDDRPTTRQALRALLTQDPQFEIVGEAGDGDSGLRLLQHSKPDLAVLGMALPGLDSLALVTQARALDDNLRLLVLDGAGEALHAGRAEAAGCHGYISDAGDSAAVLDAARLLLAGYRCFPARGRNERGQPSPVPHLTSREQEVMRSLVRGLSNKRIAEDLLLSQKTISTYKVRILEKLRLSSLVDLVDFARQHDL